MSELLLAAQQNNSTLMNASGDITNGFASSFQLGGVLAVVVGIVIVVFLASVLIQSLKAYEWFLRGLELLNDSVEYAVKGVIASIVLGAVAAPLYVVATAEPETRGMVGMVVGGIIGAYVGFVVLGYIADYLWTALKEQHEQATGEELFADLAEDDTEEE